jgi:hypothetical protein
MMQKSILDSALLGVEKKPLKMGELSGPIARQLTDRPDAPEQFLLEAAVLDTYYHEAGKLPSKLDFEPLESAIEETNPLVSKNMAAVFSLIDQSESKIKERIFNLWLDRLIEMGEIATPEILLGVLFYGNACTAKTKAKVLAVIGNRGKWLLSLDAMLNYKTPVEDNARAWEEGSTSERTAALHKVLGADVPKAVSMLRATWEEASINEKLGFIQALKSKKHKDILDFAQDLHKREFAYKATEKKREKDCRNALAMLLLAYPASELHQTTKARLQSYFKSDVKKRLMGLVKSKGNLGYKLPQEADATFWNADQMEQAYGLEGSKYDLAKYNDVLQYWLSEFLENFPAEHWIANTEHSLNDFLNCFLEGEPFKMIVRGKKQAVFLNAIIKNAHNFPNEALGLLLLERVPPREHPDLLKILKVARFEQFILDNGLETDDHILQHGPQGKDALWSLDFSEKIIQQVFDKAPKNGIPWQLGTAVAMQMPTEVNGLLQRLHSKAQEQDFFKQWTTHIYDPIHEAIRVRELLKDHH